MLKNKLMKKLEFTKFLVHQNESRMLFFIIKNKDETQNCLAKFLSILFPYIFRQNEIELCQDENQDRMNEFQFRFCEKVLLL